MASLDRMHTPTSRCVMTLVATLALSLLIPGVDAWSDGKPGNPISTENEFFSLENALRIQRLVRELSDQVASSVVKLSAGVKLEDEVYGTGVIIDPSGIVLTHGHHGLSKNAVMKATLSDGQVVDAKVESVFSGNDRDFSVLKLQRPAAYPAVPWRREKAPSAGERCFHFGFPGKVETVCPLTSPLLRLGRIAGNGQSCVYANCLITSGDSGGPLFDFQGQLIGVLNNSIGPELRHPGTWADISRILDGSTFLAEFDRDEVVHLGFTNNKRHAIDTHRHIENSFCSNLITPIRRATVEVLIDDRLVVLGTIVDQGGIVATKRSEIMTHRGIAFGELTCRLFEGEVVAAKALSDSHEDDVAFLQLERGGLTSVPFSDERMTSRGSILIVPVPHRKVSETGVISADQLVAIAPAEGYISLDVEMRDDGVTVISPFAGRLAELAHGTLKEGDVITHIEGVPTPDLAAYSRLAENDAFVGGDFVRLSLLRDGIESTVTLPLNGYAVAQDSYADPSPRLTGFPEVIIHDTIIGRRQCGGPLVDLNGKVVGVNIARFHRCSTLAIPIHRIRKLFEEEQF